MDQRRIEQAGSAHEIYTLPASAYVARFMGGQNVLSGKVASAANGVATLVGDNGERFTTPLKGVTPAEGELIHCCVRRDRVELEKCGERPLVQPDSANSLAGTVHAIEYQGSYAKVTIDVPGREQFVANVADHAFLIAPLDIGDAVVARWATEDVHLLTGDSTKAPTGVRPPLLETRRDSSRSVT